MKEQLFLDMDGILADFVTGVSQAHGRPNPYLSDPGALGVWDMEKIWGMSATDLWSPTNNFNFWAGLQKMPDADEIFALACEKVGEENIAILTAPSLSGACFTGKRAWIEKNYPSLARKIIFASAKGFLAGPGKWLIDDRDKNIEEFEAAGGRGILQPRLWNSRWKSVTY